MKVKKCIDSCSGCKHDVTGKMMKMVVKQTHVKSLIFNTRYDAVVAIFFLLNENMHLPPVVHPFLYPHKDGAGGWGLYWNWPVCQFVCQCVCLSVCMYNIDNFVL